MFILRFGRAVLWLIRYRTFSNLWTRGELDPFLLHAMELYYRCTTGPVKAFFDLICGPERSRTADLRNANAAHYQLCYRPETIQLFYHITF